MNPAILLFLYPFLFQINCHCWCQRFSTGQNMADVLHCSHLSSCGVDADGDQWDFGCWKKCCGAGPAPRWGPRGWNGWSHLEIGDDKAWRKMIAADGRAAGQRESTGNRFLWTHWSRVENPFGSHDECKNILSIPFNSDLLGGRSLEMSCSGIPWICS